MFDNQFYPTPLALASRMVAKVQNRSDIGEVLDPSGGKGDLLDAYKGGRHHYGYDPTKMFAIEVNRDLRSILRGKGYTVIDHDFLAWSGPDKFDLILMNPPFADGDKHLLKAIDIMYSGQIVCLLNAETLRNPYTNSRSELLRKLEELDAEIEFVQGAFQFAERKTDVEVALIYINIDRKIEEDLFAGCKEAQDFQATISEKYEVVTGKQIEDMVAEYNEIVKLTTETILNYYRHYNKVGRYVSLNQEPGKYSHRTSSDLTSLVKSTVNESVRDIRRDYWRRTLTLEEVRRQMTKKRLEEFEHTLKDRSNLDFTASNIRSFLLNLIAGYEATLTQAVLEVFDWFTRKYAWDESIHNGNVHYYNGWKTNSSFKVNKKVIFPCYGSYGGAFYDAMFSKWKLNYDTARELADIDIVMNYFDGCPHYTSITKALNNALERGQNRNIESTYFRITVFKKGTIHLTFKDDDILRRFNVAASRGKGWLPMDYGSKSYQSMNTEEQAVVDAFEIGGASEYEKYVGRPVFEPKWTQPLMLEEAA